MAHSLTTKETANFFRSTVVVIDLFTDALRMIMRQKIPDTDIWTVAKFHTAVLKFNQAQRKLMKTTKICGYMKLDICILYRLIRNVSKVEPPTKGWGLLPPPNLKPTIGDIVERILHTRNEFFAHVPSCKISDTEYEALWKDMEDICGQLDVIITGANFTSKLLEISSADLNPEEEKEYEEILKFQMDISSEVSKVRDALTSHEERIGNLEQFIHKETCSRRQKMTDEDRKSLDKRILSILLMEYDEITSVVPLSPLVSNFGLSVEQLCISVDVEENLAAREHKPRRVENVDRRLLKSYYDLFHVYDIEARRIFLYADAGYGKTCYALKLITEWVNAKKNEEKGLRASAEEQLLRNFHYLFYVSLRHVKHCTGSYSVSDLICMDQLLNNQSKQIHKRVREILMGDKHHCLIILDGLDEWPLKILPSTVHLENCQFLLTSRPSKLAQLNLQYKRDDKIITLLGFDDNAVEKLLSTVMEKFYDLPPSSPEFVVRKADLLRRLKSSDISSIVKIPLFANYLIVLFYENRNIGTTHTSLYLEMVALLIEKAVSENRIPRQVSSALKQMSKKVSSVEGLPFSFEHMAALSRLGQVGLENLTSEFPSLVFHTVNFDSVLGKHGACIRDFGLHTGIIRKSVIPGMTLSQSSFNFFHKSAQELLASLHISHEYQDISTLLPRIFRSLDDVLNSFQLCIFTAGLKKEFGCEILRFLSEMASQDDRVRCYRKSLTSTWKNQAKTVHELYCNIVSELLESGLEESLIPALPIDIFIDQDSSKKTVQVTSRILAQQDTAIPSLFVHNLPDDDTDITNTVVENFLMTSSDLESLYISLGKLGDVGENFSYLSALVLKDVTLSSDISCKLIEALAINENISTLRLSHIHNEDAPVDLHVSDQCINILTNLTLEGLILTEESFVSLQSVFIDNRILSVLVLKDLNTTDVSFYLNLQQKPDLIDLELTDMTIVSEDAGFLECNESLLYLQLSNITLDIDINFSNKMNLRSLSLSHLYLTPNSTKELREAVKTMEKLEDLTLDSIHFGEGVFGFRLTKKERLRTLFLKELKLPEILLDNSMFSIEKVVISDIDLPIVKWKQFLGSVKNIRHEMHVELLDVNTDEYFRTTVMQSNEFRVASYERGDRYTLKFFRVMPRL